MIKILAWLFIAIILLSIFWIMLSILLDIRCDGNRNRDDCLELKFNQFKKFYSINPGKYDLCDHTVIRRDSYKSGFPTHKIKFNIIDTLRYMHFKKEIEKNRVNDYMNNKMKEYLSFVQDDIDELNQEAQEAIEKAKREVEK